MKRILSFIILSIITTAIAIAAGKPEIKFESTVHDFGTIKASGGTVTATYRFTNTGDAPLVIIKVTNGGCGCTTPSYPKQPIAPNATGEITIKFDPQGRRGEFNRQVKVTTNAKNKRTSLKFSGAIIP